MFRISENRSNLLFIGLGVMGGIMLWWWLQRQSRWEGWPEVEFEAKPGPLPPTARVVSPPERAVPPVETERTPIPAPPSPPDDLQVIKGIGPRINEVLHAAGINTFQELAGADVDRLAQILNDAEIPLADPSAWPEQAALAAREDWQALEDMQNKLS